jgi:hypothetical protein
MKVENYTAALAAQFQICEQLRFVNRKDMFTAFEFENGSLVNQFSPCLDASVVNHV